jgi:hypothetical protein
MCVNHEILPAMDPEGEFEFSFVGFDAKSDSEKADLASKQIKAYKTVNEVRQEQGLDEREDCEVILDNTWLQAKQAAEQAEQAPGEEMSEMGSPVDNMVDNGDLKGQPEDKEPPKEEEPEGDEEWKTWLKESQKGPGGW